MKNPKIKLIEKRKIFNIGNAKYYKLLSNNLNIILLKNETAPLLSFQIWYDVGSGNEIDNIKTGQAHFLEHMMFRGSKKYPQGVFDTILDEAGGGGSNAFTSMDFTAYTVELPSEKLELILNLESDRMKNLDINSKSLNLERGAILNERTLRVDDDPSGKSWEVLLNNIYKNTSYQHDTIGSKEDIEAISVEDCNYFYNKFYSPNNATIVITGDFDEENTLSLIDKYFSPINESNIVKKVFNSFNITADNMVINKEFDVLFDKFLIAYQATNFTDNDFFKLKLLSVILTDTRTAFLKKEYIDTDKLININSDILYLKFPSIFIIDGSLKKIKKEDILDDLDNKMSFFIENISKDDLQVAKTKFKTGLTVSFSSNYKISSLFGESISLTSSPFYIYDKLNDIDKITVSDIKNIFNKYIVPKNRVTVLISKRKDNEV